VSNFWGSVQDYFKQNSNFIILEENEYIKNNIDMMYLKTTGKDPSINAEVFSILWSFITEEKIYHFWLHSGIKAKVEMDNYFNLLQNTLERK
jgi:hypothetical protein